jgi:hypothetical protein
MTASAEAGITIDVRLKGINTDYKKAITAVRNNIVIEFEEDYGNDYGLSGKIANGLGKGLPMKITIYKYNNGAILIESSGERLNAQLYRRILSTFRYKGRGYQGLQVSSTPVDVTGTMCRMDAKLCPDGTSVGRNGPNCEFAACPL